MLHNKKVPHSHRIAWIVYNFGSGVLTYMVFRTNFHHLLISILVFEFIYYLWKHKHYHFINRYFFNEFYILGYIVGLMLHKHYESSKINDLDNPDLNEE